MTIFTPICHCLDCGTEMDAVTCVTSDAVPKNGDITFCLKCGHIMAFNDDLTVRPLTDVEMYEIAGDRKIIMISEAIHEFHNMKSIE